MAYEERKSERKTIALKGYIFGVTAQVIPCVIADASDGGAQLLLSGAQSLPDQFELRFSPMAPQGRICVVRWRKNDSVGVQYLKPR